MKYSYANMPDKTKEGVDRELQAGLTKIAFWFATTQGIPKDIFVEDYMSRFNNRAEQLLFYMNFRNQHPEVFAS